MAWKTFLIYLLVMAGVTYLIRMLPLAAIRGKVKSVFLQSFLYYVPYAVLSAMTVPSIFYCTEDLLPSLAGLFAAVTVALFGKSLLTVALSSCGAVLICEALNMLLHTL